MYIGRVSGTVVATIKNELFQGRKLLVVDQAGPGGQADRPVRHRRGHGPGRASATWCWSSTRATRPGRSLDREPNGAIRAVIVGIVDAGGHPRRDL